MLYLLSSASVAFLSIKNTYFAKSNWTAKKAREINIAGLKDILNKTQSFITQKKHTSNWHFTETRGKVFRE